MVEKNSPKIEIEKVETVGKKCIELLKIDKNKKIKFKTRDDIETSNVESKIKNELYQINLKVENGSVKLSTIIHELSHIKTKQVDLFSGFPQFIICILNSPFDFIVYFYEIYFIKIRPPECV